MSNFKYPTWDEIAYYSYMLAKDIKKTYNPDVIIGLLRGGIIPARIMADYFNIRMDFFAMDVKLYTGINQTLESPIIRNFSENIHGKSILIVDEIFDSGKTMKAVLEYLKGETIKTATIYCREGTVERPDFSYKIALKNDWIIFPWEKYESGLMME